MVLRLRLVTELVLLAGAFGVTGCGTEWAVADKDDDGLTVAEGDCWDDEAGPEGSGLTGADIHPGATETWYDGIDQDCGGDDDFDLDGDGYVPEESQVGRATLGVPGSGGDNHKGFGDCWDDPEVTPEGFEVVRGDTDVNGNPYPQLEAAQVHPGSGDTWYDGVDQDCGANDDFDQDGDGYRSLYHKDAAGAVGDDCVDGSWRDDDVPDDASATGIHPGASEVCDDIDNDCDSLVDGADPDVNTSTTRTLYADTDGDTYGDPDVETLSCDSMAGWVSDDTDCDDGDANVHPGADEVCNELDDDCDSVADEDAVDAGTWYADTDSDTYGDPDNSVLACTVPEGYRDNALDCDDGAADVNPDALEYCDGYDNDCDGATDEDDAADAATWYADTDGDTYGDPGATTVGCDQPTGYVGNDDDCDDTLASTSPDGTEICDGVDNDCDDNVDDDDDSLDLGSAGTFYADADGDGYGDASSTTLACEQPSGYLTDATDCDDDDAAIHPGATEVCDEQDNDCDGKTDDDDSSLDKSTADTWYRDTDSDGYGTSATTKKACELPSGYSDNAEDCDDTDAAVSPAADEICNDGIDNDCDETLGTTSDGGTCVLVDLGLASADLVILGAAAGDAAGQSLATGGDVDGDTVADFLVGAPYADTAASNAGGAYLFGGSSALATVGSPGSGSVSDAVALFQGDGASDLGGLAVGMGDVDGDGYADVTMGAPLYESGSNIETGIAYLFFGPVTGTITAAAADCYYQRSHDYAHTGASLAMSGDVSGDGVADLVVGSPRSTLVPGASDDGGAGYATLLSGGDLTGCSGSIWRTAWFQQAETDDAAGYAVAVGDLDGDGVAEVAGGAPTSTAGGTVYVAQYSSDTSVYWTSGDAFEAEAAGDQAGIAVAIAGDVTGDGIDDLLVGADLNDGGGTDAGAVYLLASPISGAGATTTSLADASAIVRGNTASDGLGNALAAAGDIDGDGTDDFVAGAWKDETRGGTDPGSALLFLGPVSGTLSLSDADAVLGGSANRDHAAYSLAGGADLNDDGLPDLLVGAPHVDSAGSNGGAAYLILGLGQ